MPSSLIIVALAAAWLVVLVPMIARKRQEVTQTNDSALAARVVRSGSARSEGRKEFAVAEDATSADDRRDDEDLVEDDYDADLDDEFDEDLDDERDEVFDERDEEYAESELGRAYADDGEPVRRYRPGRGGFDPEAAEIAAKAKYAYRQRIVLGLIVAAVLTAVVAVVVLPILWWVHGIADIGLVGYLVYLRRQVRIEDEIRERRLSRLSAAPPAPAPAPAATRRRRPEPLDDVEVPEPDPREVVGAERRPVPMSRTRRNAVVVDLEDEDPAFHELEDPAQLPYRKAAGE